MAGYDEQDFDGGWDRSSGQGAVPLINGALLDPRTFPEPWPSAVTDAPSVEPQAPAIGPLGNDVRAEVLKDIQDARAKLPPIFPDGLAGLDDKSLQQLVSVAGQPFPARWSPVVRDGPSLQRPPAAITGPLMTDAHAEVFQNFVNAQAGLPPVRPHPETWSINGQPYLAISARSFDPTRSYGVNAAPTPAEDAAAWADRPQVAVPYGTAGERVGYIVNLPVAPTATDVDPITGLIRTRRTRPMVLRAPAAKTDVTDSAYTAAVPPLDGASGYIHGHMDSAPDEKGMVDDPP